MVIVQVVGGVASQMCAFMRGWLVATRLNKELVLDVADYVNGYKFPYALDYFDITCRKLAYTHASYEVISEKVIPRTIIEEYNPYILCTTGRELEEVYAEADQHKERNIYLVGETCKLPNHVGEELENIFRIRDNEFIDCFKRNIENVISVAVHVRRTDFVSLRWNNGYEYYEAAINYIEEKIPNSVFFFFSDDIEEVKKHFCRRENFRFVRLPGGFATDVIEMQCMSLCDHRIMTTRSGYSSWAMKLNQNPNAMNIIFSEEPQELCVNLNNAMIAEYLQKENEKRLVLRHSSWEADEEYIVNALKCKKDTESAIERICKVGFDCGDMSVDYLDKLYGYYEEILFEKDEYVKAEQALMRHLEIKPDSIEAHCNMAVAKRMLGRTMAAYLHASRVCREVLEPAYLNLFVDEFLSDSTFSYFEQLCTAPKLHFIVCPVSNANFYVKHSISMAILLKLLGHEVSIINPVAAGVKLNSNTTAKELINLCLNNATEIESTYKHQIPIYPYVSIKNMNNHAALVEALAQDKKLPTVIIGRTPLAAQSAERYPMLYWDFSEELDLDAQMMRKNPEWKRIDEFMRMRATAIISTKPMEENIGQGKCIVVDTYVKKEPFWVEDKMFCANYVNDESFLKFVYEVVIVAASLFKKNC